MIFLENIKSLQLSPSVLEELVQKHYIENKKDCFFRGKSFKGLQWIKKFQEMNLLSFI